MQLLAFERVEGRERLVHEQQVRVERHGACECEALSHATRELAGVRVRELAEAHACQRVGRPLTHLASPEPADLQAEAGILGDGLPRQQAEVLEDERRLAARAGDGRAADGDGARVGGRSAGSRDASRDAGARNRAAAQAVLRQQPSGQQQQRRLAAAAGADDGDRFPVGHFEVEVVEGPDLTVRTLVRERYVIEAKRCHAGATGPSRE